MQYYIIYVDKDDDDDDDDDNDDDDDDDDNDKFLILFCYKVIKNYNIVKNTIFFPLRKVCRSCFVHLFLPAPLTTSSCHPPFPASPFLS